MPLCSLRYAVVLGWTLTCCVHAVNGSRLVASTLILSEWDGGASVSVLIQNPISSAFIAEGWEATWVWQNDEVITFSWDASFTTEPVLAGNKVTAQALSKNAYIEPGKTIAFGFNLEGSMANLDPLIELTYNEIPIENGSGSSGGLVVSYEVEGVWGHDVEGAGSDPTFVASIIITNTGVIPVSTWCVWWEWPSGQESVVLFSWSALFEVEDQIVEVKPYADAQMEIAPGEKYRLGFFARGDASSLPPILAVEESENCASASSSPGDVWSPPDEADQQTVVPLGPIEPVQPLHDILGTQIIGPHYQLTSDTKLVEAAKAIRAMGSNILKIVLSPQFYDIYGAEHLEYQYKRLLQEEPSFREVLQMDFAHYFFWVETAGEFVDGNGMTAEEQQREYDRLYDLSTWLLQTFDNTGKSFYLGHWEGDWRLLNDETTQWDRNRTDAPQHIIDGMIDWLNVRQSAVDQAKADYLPSTTKVDLYHYVELNLVETAYLGWDRVVNRVLPFVNVDLVSYSCYDSTTKIDNEEELRNRLTAALDYVEDQLPDKPGLPFRRRVFIGEFGFPHYNIWMYEDMAAEQNRRGTWLIQTALDWGCPFILYWQLYDNEYNSCYNSYNGFWLIDNLGNKLPLYETYANYYIYMDGWKADFLSEWGREPSQDEIYGSAAGLFGLSVAAGAA